MTKGILRLQLVQVLLLVALCSYQGVCIYRSRKSLNEIKAYIKENVDLMDTIEHE